MLIFLVKETAQYTIASYLEHWAPELKGDLSFRTYESLGTSGIFPPGTYVFCDHERWSDQEKSLAVELWNQLETFESSHVLLNHPRKVLSRYQLLKTLHAAGRNQFDVHWPSSAVLRTRYPVFLHSTNNHEGALSPLLQNRWQLIRWLLKRVRPRRWGRLLVEEFCDVGDASRHYKKFSSFHLGGEILARHVFVGLEWCLKDSEILDEPALKLYESYLQDNPDEAVLAPIFQLAGVDYGRIDYSWKEDSIQVWEINTNPMIIGFPDTMYNVESPLTEKFRHSVQPHLLRLARLHAGGRDASYRLPGKFRAR